MGQGASAEVDKVDTIDGGFPPVLGGAPGRLERGSARPTASREEPAGSKSGGQGEDAQSRGCRTAVFSSVDSDGVRARDVGVAEQPFAGVGGVFAGINFVMEAGDERAFDAAGGADPGGVGDDGDAIGLADQAQDEGEVAELLGDGREGDARRAADIGEDVEAGGVVEDFGELGEGGGYVGGGEVAGGGDFDGSGGEGGDG